MSGTLGTPCTQPILFSCTADAEYGYRSALLGASIRIRIGTLALARPCATVKHHERIVCDDVIRRLNLNRMIHMLCNTNRLSLR